MLVIRGSMFASFSVTREFCRESITRQNFFNFFVLYKLVSYIAFMYNLALNRLLATTSLWLQE